MALLNQHKIINTYYCLFIIICIIALSSANRDNYLVLKNDKVFALKITNQISPQSQDKINTLWIRNSQQSINIELPLLNNPKDKQHQISNYTRYLPIFYSLLQTKGYIKPLKPFNSVSQQFVKGYKYTKPSYHDPNVYEIYQQIQSFIKAVIQTNQLNYLNLRMEDSFQIQVISNPSTSSFVIKSINVKYLFTTVTKDSLPATILNSLGSNILNYDEFLSNQIAGTVERKLHGKGLHQWVNHTVVLQDLADIQLQSIRETCQFQFTDVLPESTYIDSDQRRKQTTNYQTINVQKPAFASKQYFYRYRVPLTQLVQTGVRKYTYSQPVHFRYPSPSLLNYTKVYLHPIEQARIVCNEDSSNKQVQPLVYHLQQSPLFERGTAKLPNADISKSKIVSITTLVVCLVTALIILKNLKKQ